MRLFLRYLVAAFYLLAGIMHLAYPAPFLSIMPHWVPLPAAVVSLTGVAELFGAIGLAQPFSKRLRRAAAIGLAGYAICVFPANITHFTQDMAKPDGGLGLVYHVPRMVLQPVLVWLALWAGSVVDWPFRASRPDPTD